MIIDAVAIGVFADGNSSQVRWDMKAPTPTNSIVVNPTLPAPVADTSSDSAGEISQEELRLEKKAQKAKKQGGRLGDIFG